MRTLRPKKKAQPEPEAPDAKQKETPEAVRDGWLEDQEILKDFYQHVVLQDTDLGLPSIQSTLPGWLNARLLEAYTAGYGHSSVRVIGLVVEIERLEGLRRENVEQLNILKTALRTIRDKGSEVSLEDRRISGLAASALADAAAVPSAES